MILFLRRFDINSFVVKPWSMTGFNHYIPWPPSWFTTHSATPYHNTVSYLYVKLKGVTSSGRRTRPACNLGHSRDFFFIKYKKYDFFHSTIVCAVFFLHFRPSPFPTQFRDLGSRVTWCLSRPLIGRIGSREQSDDVPYANEARDPKRQ